jgi:hypothetical protein
MPLSTLGESRNEGSIRLLDPRGLIQPASISATLCPGEHHDFGFMGAILLRVTTVNGTAERPQNADIELFTRQTYCGTLRLFFPEVCSAE